MRLSRFSPLQASILMSAILVMLLYGGTGTFIDLMFYTESRTVEITCKQIITRDVPSKDGNDFINAVFWLTDRKTGDGHNLYCIEWPAGAQLKSRDNHMIGDSIEISVSSRDRKRILWGSLTKNRLGYLVWLCMTLYALRSVVVLWRDFFRKRRN